MAQLPENVTKTILIKTCFISSLSIVLSINNVIYKKHFLAQYSWVWLEYRDVHYICTENEINWNKNCYNYFNLAG